MERQLWASPPPTVDVAQRVYAEYGFATSDPYQPHMGQRTPAGNELLGSGECSAAECVQLCWVACTDAASSSSHTSSSRSPGYLSRLNNNVPSLAWNWRSLRTCPLPAWASREPVYPSCSLTRKCSCNIHMFAVRTYLAELEPLLILAFIH